jgi:hypothetical protein
MIPKATALLRLSFWSRVKKGPGCWEWQGGRFDLRGGYGCISISRKNHLAHRVSYEWNIGAIPRGLWVLHKCDNPPCVRPDHLFLGNQAANMADAKAKGRLHTKFCAADIRAMRAALAAGADYRSVMSRFGISKAWLWRVRTLRVWKHG